MRHRSALTSVLTAFAGLGLLAGTTAALGTGAVAAPAVHTADSVAAERSTKITVKVSPKRVAVGERFVVRGKVRPKAPGKVVRLQRKKSGGWKSVDRDRLNKKSRYRFVRKMRTTGKLRLRVIRTHTKKRNARSKARVVRTLRNGRAPSTGGGSTGSNGSSSHSAREMKVLQLTNRLRAKGTRCGGTWYGPAPALKANAKLARAAQQHSDDMVRNGYFDHVSANGDGPAERANRAGYSWSRIGENIAWGYATAEDVIDGWVRSEGHCRNMMNPDYDHLGIGSTGSGSPKWVQLFGTPL